MQIEGWGGAPLKIALGSNLLIGDAGTLDMPVEVFSKWNEDKIEALAGALEKAKELGAEAFVMLGGLFGEGFVPAKLVDEAFEELVCHEIPVAYHPRANEDSASRAPRESRLIPCSVESREREGIESPVFSLGGKLMYAASEGDVGSDLLLGSSRIAFSSSFDKEGPCIATKTGDGIRLISLGNMEPQGFSDPLPSGFMLLTVGDSNTATAEWVEMAEHPFVATRVDLSGLSDSKEIIPIYTDAVRNIDTRSCVRVEFAGRAALNLSFNVQELEQRLRKRFFYAEVSNECTVEVEDEDVASSASLLSEFERLVLADRELSDTEKARILRCGWGVLNGKEIVE